MTRNVPRKLQRSDLLRKKRAQASAVLALGAKSPARAIPVASASPRPSVGLPAHRYPVKKVCLGDRQAVAPLGRGDK
jgi:hypothetical protein